MSDHLHLLTHQVLERGYVLSLGIVDAQGPWVADVIYVFDEHFNLYWMSKLERRHSQAIDGGCERVAGAIVVTQRPDQPDEGLQVSGIAKRLDQPPKKLLKQWMEKMQRPFDPDLGVVLENHVWYRMIPDRIELIYQEEFGYDRQNIV